MAGATKQQVGLKSMSMCIRNLVMLSMGFVAVPWYCYAQNDGRNLREPLFNAPILLRVGNDYESVTDFSGRFKNSLIGIGKHNVHGPVFDAEGQWQLVRVRRDFIHSVYDVKFRLYPSKDGKKWVFPYTKLVYDLTTDRIHRFEEFPEQEVTELQSGELPVAVDPAKMIVVYYSATGNLRRDEEHGTIDAVSGGDLGRFMAYDVETGEWRSPIDSKLQVLGLAFNPAKGFLAIVNTKPITNLFQLSKADGAFESLAIVWLDETFSPVGKEVEILATEEDLEEGRRFFESWFPRRNSPELYCVDKHLFVRWSSDHLTKISDHLTTINVESGETLESVALGERRPEAREEIRRGDGNAPRSRRLRRLKFTIEEISKLEQPPERSFDLILSDETEVPMADVVQDLHRHRNHVGYGGKSYLIRYGLTESEEATILAAVDRWRSRGFDQFEPAKTGEEGE